MEEKEKIKIYITPQQRQEFDSFLEVTIDRYKRLYFSNGHITIEKTIKDVVDECLNKYDEFILGSVIKKKETTLEDIAEMITVNDKAKELSKKD